MTWTFLGASLITSAALPTCLIRSPSINIPAPSMYFPDERVSSRPAFTRMTVCGFTSVSDCARAKKLHRPSKGDRSKNARPSVPFHNHRGITVQLSFTSEWQHSHATRHNAPLLLIHDSCLAPD